MRRCFTTRKQSSWYRITQMHITIAETFFLQMAASTKQSRTGRKVSNSNRMTRMPILALVTRCCGRVFPTKRSLIMKKHQNSRRKIPVRATTSPGYWRPLPTPQFATAPGRLPLRMKQWSFQTAENPLSCAPSPLLTQRAVGSLRRSPWPGRPQL